jgi:hypothetical protein
MASQLLNSFLFHQEDELDSDLEEEKETIKRNVEQLLEGTSLEKELNNTHVIKVVIIAIAVVANIESQYGK